MSNLVCKEESSAHLQAGAPTAWGPRGRGSEAAICPPPAPVRALKNEAVIQGEKVECGGWQGESCDSQQEAGGGVGRGGS